MKYENGMIHENGTNVIICVEGFICKATICDYEPILRSDNSFGCHSYAITSLIPYNPSDNLIDIKSYQTADNGVQGVNIHLKPYSHSNKLWIRQDEILKTI